MCDKDKKLKEEAFMSQVIDGVIALSDLPAEAAASLKTETLKELQRVKNKPPIDPKTIPRFESLPQEEKIRISKLVRLLVDFKLKFSEYAPIPGTVDFVKIKAERDMENMLIAEMISHD